MKILLTGITGTWGRAFTELLGNDHDLIGIDHNEQNVAMFNRLYPEITVILGNFDDFDFETIKVDLVIHLAAHKHIGICENNAYEACLNNVTRTAHLFKNAHKNGVKILFISTDKAVEPLGVYGMTKALGEHLAHEFDGVVARSGNVVASNGSVLQVWDKQIKDNQPLTVTDLNFKRYFISPEDVVKKVWQGYNEGKKLIVPDMGEAVSVGDLLEKCLAEHGYSNIADYEPGCKKMESPTHEKMIEKLLWDWEKIEAVK